ncbi:MAG: hypothetical protein FWG48_04685 [Oscillospiraceae bacterium]|nr:hypothetical protein [Oscillospiraceae bacterium]
MRKLIIIVCVAALLACAAGCEKIDNGPQASEPTASPDVSSGAQATESASGSPSVSVDPKPETPPSTGNAVDPGGTETPPTTGEIEKAPETPETSETTGGQETSAPPSPVTPTPSASATEEPPESTPPETDGSPDTPSGSIADESLETIMEMIYNNLDDSVVVPFVGNMTLSEDMPFPESGIVYYIGARGIPFTEGIASEAMIGSIAHSVVLLRLAPGSNVDNVKKEIKENIDPMKWICNGVTREEVVVENIGNIVMLVLSPNGPDYREAFLKLG